MSGTSKKSMTLVSARERADAKALEVVLAALNDVSVADLRKEWARLYRSHPPKKLSCDLLTLGVAWKLQERAFGGLSAANRRQLDACTKTMETKADLAKTRTVTLRPGARLIRDWNGEINEVLVVEDGFHWRGKKWRSLSMIARELTGTHWSGPRFFGLNAGRRNG